MNKHLKFTNILYPLAMLLIAGMNPMRTYAASFGYMISDLGSIAPDNGTWYYKWYCGGLNNYGEVATYTLDDITSYSVGNTTGYKWTASDGFIKISNGMCLGINDGGLIAGAYRKQNGYYGAAKWLPSTMNSNTGQLFYLDTGTSHTSSVGLAINNQGNIVGYVDPDGTKPLAAYMNSSGVITTFNANLSHQSTALDINNNGISVGWTMSNPNDLDQPYAFKTSNTTIDTWSNPSNNILLSSESVANSINENGDIVGYFHTVANDRTSPYHAFLLPHGSQNKIDLGTLGGSNSSAYAVSNDGTTVLGFSEFTPNDNHIHAFIWKRTLYTYPIVCQMYDLNDFIPDLSGFGSLGIAYAINERGQILCFAKAYTSGSTFDFNDHNYLLTPINVTYSGENKQNIIKVYDLDTLDTTLNNGAIQYNGSSWAYAINNKNQIVGSSTMSDGTTHAFIWAQHRVWLLSDVISS